MAFHGWGVEIIIKELFIELHDLLIFEVKHSKRHGLDRVSISLPRATLIIHHITDKLKEHKNQTRRAQYEVSNRNKVYSKRIRFNS